MRSRDKGAFLRAVKQARKMTDKVELILFDPSHPLHLKFAMSYTGKRLL